MMITRVYIDNFRCFTNFEWNVGEFSLLLGENGSGKSSLFDVVFRLIHFARGEFDTAAFGPRHNKTAWDPRTEQVFELGMGSESGEFLYRLVLIYPNQRDEAEVVEEILKFGGTCLYERKLGDVALFDDNGAPLGRFPFSGSRSMLGMISSGSGRELLQSFSSILDRCFFFKPDPLSMRSVSDDVPVAAPNMNNLVGWLVHLGAMSADFASRLLHDLREVMPGLQTYGLLPAGINSRALQLSFRLNGGDAKSAPVPLFLEQISDGQRMLVAIYTILHGIVGPDSIVFLDEPDNYISSRELQPWLRSLEEKLDEGGGQVLMISHHPEIVNYLAPNNGVLFYREDNGPVRVKRVEWDGMDELTPAEAVARGWLE